MISLDLKSLRRNYHPLHICCKLGDVAVWGMTTDISSKGFCLEVPTPRIKMCLLNLLNKDVILEIQNVIIDGSIDWYTIEGDRYCIGISINKWHIPTWKKLLAVSCRPVVDSGMEQAQI